MINCSTHFTETCLCNWCWLLRKLLISFLFHTRLIFVITGSLTTFTGNIWLFNSDQSVDTMWDTMYNNAGTHKIRLRSMKLLPQCMLGGISNTSTSCNSNHTTSTQPIIWMLIMVSTLYSFRLCYLWWLHPGLTYQSSNCIQRTKLPGWELTGLF